ncbi:MAG: hypothetical protein PHW73_00975 [Atribacterota bacterium]|nr:hypothetical protein [Atribacterota bacterium]
MTQYKVKVLRVQGINNKTYKAGETVNDKTFPEGVAEQLAEKGYLIKIADAKQTAKEKAEQKKVLKKAVDDAEYKLEDAEKALKKASEEEKEAFAKAVEDAGFALEEAKEALENFS